MCRFEDYINAGNVLELCRQIQMPEEAVEQLAVIIDGCDFMLIADEFYKLFDINKGMEAYESIDAFCGRECNGLKALAVYLMSALHTKEIYQERGIDLDIYIKTMKMFTRFVNEYMNSYGEYGFDRGFWVYRILSVNLMRIGELEYEMYHMNKDYDGYLRKGDSVLSVHIPSDAALTKTSLSESYSRADEFFKECFPDYVYKYFYTHTWLLSPELKKLLPETSKILLFQSDYEIISVNEEDNSFMQWVYKRNYEDYAELPEETSLQRNIKVHLMTGGKIGSGAGVIKCR